MCLWASRERSMRDDRRSRSSFGLWGCNPPRKKLRSLAEIGTRTPWNTRITPLDNIYNSFYIIAPDSDANFPATFAVIHTKETTVNETKAGRTAAPLGNFVVKVALRITDARQEVGTAEAARGPGAWTRGARGRRGRRCIVGVSGRAKWKKKAL